MNRESGTGVRSPTRVGISVCLLAALVVSAPSVSADAGSYRDPDDSAGRLDVKTLRHGHTSSGALRHVVVTREGWTKRGFRRRGGLTLLFSVSGNNCADAEVVIDVHDGRWRARWRGYDPLGCGPYDDSGGYSDFYGNIRIRKPAAHRAVVVVPRSLFPPRATEYLWAVTSTWACRQPCGDNAPDRPNADRTLIRHRL